MHKITVQNTNAAMQHTGCYTLYKYNICHEQYPKVNLMFYSLKFLVFMILHKNK